MGGYATNPDTNSASEITGSGTANYLAKFTSAQTIGNSGIYDDGATITFTRPSRFNDTMYIETEGIITWSSATALAIYATVSDFNLVTQAAKAITLFNNNTETMRLFANNNVSIGYGLAVSARLQVVGSTNDDTGYAFKAMSLNLTELLNVRNDGKIGIGTTSLSAVLTLKAGTASANTAPLKFTSGTSLTSAESGAVEYDGNNFLVTEASTQRKAIVGCVYTQTTSVTVANSVAETSILTSTTTLPANFFVAGKQIRLKFLGFHSAAMTPTIRVKIKLGSTVLLDTGVVTSGNSTNALTEINGMLTCRTTGVSGTISGQGYYQELGGGANQFPMLQTGGPITVDTTTTQVLNVTVQWGTASAGNTITTTDGFISIHK